MACPIGSRAGFNAGASNRPMGPIWACGHPAGVQSGRPRCYPGLQEAPSASQPGEARTNLQGCCRQDRPREVKKGGGCIVLSPSCLCSHPPACVSSCPLHPHHTFSPGQTKLSLSHQCSPLSAPREPTVASRMSQSSPPLPLFQALHRSLDLRH